MLKKIFTYFLLLVMALQIIPVKELGSMLFNNQFQEEISHIIDIDEDGFKKSEHKSLYLDAHKLSFGSGQMYASSKYIHFVDMIPSNPHFEILVPPPNC